MTFTDDDLKRLKEEFAKPNWQIIEQFQPHKQIALLARLEAAEKSLDFAEGAIYSVYDPHKNDCPVCDNFMSPCKEYCEFPKFHEAYQAWQKAAGKS